MNIYEIGNVMSVNMDKTLFRGVNGHRLSRIKGIMNTRIDSILSRKQCLFRFLYNWKKPHLFYSFTSPVVDLSFLYESPGALPCVHLWVNPAFLFRIHGAAALFSWYE